MASGLIRPPDALPSTHLRTEVARLVKANIRQLLVDVLSDKLGHAMAVAAGKTHFREAFVRHMGAFWGNSRSDADYFADITYDGITRAWTDKYPGEQASAFLDAVHVPSAPSAKETEEAIEDAWEVEIASSDAAMERHYYGSQRVRKGRDIFSSFWQKPQSDRPQ